MVGQEPRGVAADIAEALDRRRCPTEFNAQARRRFADAHHDAAGSGALPSRRAAQFRGFASDHAGQMIVLVHDVGVHHPAHHLGACVHVRCRHVPVGAKQVDHLGHVAPGDTLAFTDRERTRIDHDATLGSAHRDADDGTLVGHPEGQRLHLVQVDGFMEPDAALAGPAGKTVLHPKRLKVANAAVIHADWQAYLGDAPGQLDHCDLIVGKAEPAGGRVELLEGVREGRDVPFLERARDLPAARGAACEAPAFGRCSFDWHAQLTPSTRGWRCRRPLSCWCRLHARPQTAASNAGRRLSVRSRTTLALRTAERRPPRRSGCD